MKRFKNILCVVDPAEASLPALERAVTLAENNQATLTVIEVIDRLNTTFGLPETPLSIPIDLQAALVDAHDQVLETLVAPYQSRLPIMTRVISGTPFLEIIHEVLRHHYDLVIKMPESPDWLDRLFGSDDMHLLRKCPCPVWLIKPMPQHTYRRILAAVDIEDAYQLSAELKTQHELSSQILALASSLALADFAELHIVNVWDAIGESAMRGAFVKASEEQIRAYVEQVRQQHRGNLDSLVHDVTAALGKQGQEYLKPHTHLVRGWARKEIPALAKQIDADLVVMGTVARTGIPGFIMGNTAETILNQINCSVLAIKPPGFITPVTPE